MARLKMDSIRAAQGLIAPIFLDSPQYENESLSSVLGCHITLKVETLNPVRCFKGRASEVVMSRLVQQKGNAAVCASAGNLGQAMAYSARSRGVKMTVIASSNANPQKLDRIKALGATLRLVEGDIELARNVARQISDSDDSYLIEDSENLDTCEGAATIGLELSSMQKPLDAVLIALGGGAMATGVGYVFQSLRPDVEIITVQPSGAPAMTLSWRSKTIVNTDSMDTIADGVAGRFPIPEVLDDLIEVADDAILVSEESIMSGMKMLFEEAGIVAEPSAALGVAALIENRERFAGRRVATIVCGSNVVVRDFINWVH